MKRRYNGKSSNWQSKWANSGNVGGYANHIEIEHTQYVMCRPVAIIIGGIYNALQNVC